MGAWIEISWWNQGKLAEDTVAPLVGAWIEINISRMPQRNTRVAPLVGAWIEILICLQACLRIYVAPLVGAWIEIVYFWMP